MRIIAGEARGRRLFEPVDDTVRPPLDRIRESVFSIIEGAFEGKTCLDLFAGIGSFGLEALSRGARKAVFVEKVPGALAVLGRNIETLGFNARARVLRGNALREPDLRELDSQEIGVVFLDPPFRMFLGEEEIEKPAERPEKQIERESASEARRWRARSREETPPVTAGAVKGSGAERPGGVSGRRHHPSAGGPRGGARKIFERVQEILSSPAISPGGLVILRHPSSWRGESPIRFHEKRAYGESTILIFRSGGAHDQIG